MILIYIGLWGGMVPLAILNGVIRTKGYEKRLGELCAHQVSSMTAIVIFGLYTLLIGIRWPLESAGQAIAVGVIWLVMTVAFEFLFGHYIGRHSWQRLLHDYNVLKGRVWVLVLAWIAVAPYVVYNIQNNV